MKYIYQSYNICINHSILLLFFSRIFYFIIPHLFISLALYINKPHSFPSCFHFHLLYSNEAWLSKDSDQRNSAGIALNHWINDFQHIGGWRWVTRRLITCCGPNQEDYAILLSPRSLKISDTGPENINPLFFFKCPSDSTGFVAYGEGKEHYHLCSARNWGFPGAAALPRDNQATLIWI